MRPSSSAPAFPDRDGTDGPADDPESGSGPARQRGPGAGRLFAGLVIAPFAWALQMLVGFGLAAHACYPADIALAQPVWPDLRRWLGGSSIALWLLLFAGCGIAWSNWRKTGPHSSAGPHDIIQHGTGRPRFMALCGVVVSGLFAVVQLFTSVGILWVPSCGP